jgi:WhiB family redox-sensing transcriptional regulator
MTAARRSNRRRSESVLVELRPPGGWTRPKPTSLASGKPAAPPSSGRSLGPPAANRSGEDRSWQDRANCLGVDPGLFFQGRGESTHEAKAICAGCVVRHECLEHALAKPEKFGIWGGTSERERRRLRRARNLARRREGQVS